MACMINKSILCRKHELIDVDSMMYLCVCTSAEKRTCWGFWASVNLYSNKLHKYCKYHCRRHLRYKNKQAFENATWL